MIREYLCTKCKEKSEFIEKYDDEPKKDCPKCGKKNSLELIVFSLSSVQFKGAGWFKTGGY
ncbi:MAG TPA: hypothetical protein PLP33_27735 [Leptospiraceae bacterium]|nr:hypothetical protein [Leptospiraceae bacterium]